MRLFKSAFIFFMILICTISLSACGKVSAANSTNPTNNTTENNPNNENTTDDDQDTEPTQKPSVNGDNEDDKETETNQDNGNNNNDEDSETTKTIASIKIADGYYQSLYNIGEDYANDIRLSVTYEDKGNTFKAEIINVATSMFDGFPAQIEGTAEIIIRLDEHKTKVKLFFADFDKKGISPKINVNPFQKSLSFNKLTAEYSYTDANDNFTYIKQISVTDYTYHINSIDYKSGESPGPGLHKNVSIYTCINSKEIPLTDPFDLVIGEITETLALDFKKDFPESYSYFHKKIEILTLFYLFLNLAYGGNTIPLAESEIWNDIRQEKLTHSFETILPYDTEKALTSNWPSGNYASDLVNGKVHNFKEAVANTYKKLLHETAFTTTIEVFLIAAPNINEGTDKDCFYLIFNLTPDNFFQYILTVNIE